MSPRLFHGLDRECCVCAAHARAGQPERPKDEPNIMGLSIVAYRRAARGGRVKSTIRVLVCEECLVKALGQGRLGFLSGNHEANTLWSSLKSRLISLHTAMVDEDTPAKDQRSPHPSPELEESLF